MKKVLLVIVMCTHFFAASAQAATVTNIIDNGNIVNAVSSPGIIAVDVDFLNLELVWIDFDPDLATEALELTAFNSTGQLWTDFHIEVQSVVSGAPIDLNITNIQPPPSSVEVGLDPITGNPVSTWIFFSPSGGDFLLAEGEIISRHNLYSLHLKPTVVPLPAAVWLFGSGLLGLAGMARRKRS